MNTRGNRQHVIGAAYDELFITPEGEHNTPLLLTMTRLLLADDPEPPAVLETGIGTTENPGHDEWEERDRLRWVAYGILAGKGVVLDA